MTNDSLAEFLKKADLSVNEDKVRLSKITVSFTVTDKTVLLVADHPAKASLLLAPESDYTQQADKIGVSEESKIGQGDFDERYVIRDPDDKAATVLTSDVVATITALEPFVELEMSSKQFRLLLEDINEEQVLHRLQKLESLVALTGATDRLR